jgi:hypothetical protein
MNPGSPFNLKNADITQAQVEFKLTRQVQASLSYLKLGYYLKFNGYACLADPPVPVDLKK